jgi:hypothetical protein
VRPDSVEDRDREDSARFPSQSAAQEARVDLRQVRAAHRLARVARRVVAVVPQAARLEAQEGRRELRRPPLPMSRPATSQRPDPSRLHVVRRTLSARSEVIMLELSCDAKRGRLPAAVTAVVLTCPSPEPSFLADCRC